MIHFCEKFMYQKLFLEEIKPGVLLNFLPFMHPNTEVSRSWDTLNNFEVIMSYY